MSLANFPPHPDTHINNTKSFIGHCMGAAGALELAGNLPAFTDQVVHPTINVDELDPACALPNELLEQVDILTPNESEAMLLIGAYGWYRLSPNTSR